MKKENKVANIVLQEDEATIVTPNELYRWVIWQFPRRFGDGLCGAVRPPLASYGWLPAVIYQDKIAVQAHLQAPFDSPEAAVSFLQQQQPT